MKIANPPSPPFSPRPRAVSDPEGKGGWGGFENCFQGNEESIILESLILSLDITNWNESHHTFADSRQLRGQNDIVNIFVGITRLLGQARP